MAETPEKADKDLADEIREIRRAVQIIAVTVVLIAAGLAVILLGNVTINVRAQP